MTFVFLLIGIFVGASTHGFTGALLGGGMLMLLIGYLSPVPPHKMARES